MLFSYIEIRDIIISLLVLCVVFSYPDFLFNPAFFFIGCLAVGLAFIGHELAHKFAAIRHGYWSEYRMWPQGLVMALLFALATNGSIIFAAPGAVLFSAGSFFKHPSRKELTEISMAGISFNIVLMWITLGLYFASGLAIFTYMAFINGWLAIFNLIPFGGLDGQKLIKYDKNIWMLLLVLGVSGFIISRLI